MIRAGTSRRSRAARLGRGVALCLALASGAARAQAPSAPAPLPDAAPTPALRGLVILFSAPSAEALAGRLDAELLAAGLVPRRVAIPAAPPFGDLTGIASAARAEGAIRVEPDASGAEVWLTDRAPGRTRLRQSLSAEPSPATIPVIALRTVEFLRASLLPAEASPPPVPSAPVVVTAPAEAPAAASRSPFRGWLAPAWLGSPGGASRTISAAAGASLRLGAHLGLEALALVPLSEARVDTIEGETRLGIYLAGAGAQLRGSTGPWTGDVGAGALASLVRATGTPRGGFVGSTESMMAVAPYARAGLALGVAPWLALRADVLMGALTPRPTIGLVGSDTIARDTASWGRPFGALFVGLQGGGS